MIVYLAIGLFFSLILSPTLVFADVTYYYSYTTGTDVRFSSITVTGASISGAGLRPGRTFTYPSSSNVGTTAISPVYNDTTVTGFHIFKNAVGANNKPVISRLEVNPAGQLQNELQSPKLKPTNFNVLDAFQSGSLFRLLITVGNDVFGAKLNSDGIAPGSRQRIFNNSAGLAVVSSAMYQDGDAALQGTFRQTANLSYNPIPHFLPLTGEQCRCVRLAQLERCDCRPSEVSLSHDHSCDLHFEDDDPSDDPDLRPAAAQQGGTVLIASRFFKGLGTAKPQSQVRLQVLDFATGEFGPEKAVSKFAAARNLGAENFRSVAMAEFVVLYTVSASCGQILRAQQINESGNNVGSPKTLVSCSKIPAGSPGVYGLDIIEP